jgi:hypothetical protein
MVCPADTDSPSVRRAFLPLVDDLVAGDSGPRRQLESSAASLADHVELLTRIECAERRRDENLETAAELEVRRLAPSRGHPR